MLSNLLFFIFIYRLLIFCFKLTCSEESFGKTIRVANRLHPDQARRFVGPDLGLNCLQWLFTKDTSRRRATTIGLYFELM